MGEAIAVAKDNGGDLAKAGAYLEIPLGRLQVAASYYAAHPREIDEQIERNRREADDAHAAFLAAGGSLADGEDWL